MEAAWQEAQRLREGSRIPLPRPRPDQSEVLQSPSRFKVLCCGRRYGKSTLALIQLVQEATRVRNGLYWWIFPTHTIGHVGWDMLRKVVEKSLHKDDVSEYRRRVRFKSGSEIWVKSSDNEDGLRGSGLTGVIFDECRDIRDRAWHEVIRPSLMDNQESWGWFTSSPRGHDWFYQLWVRGQDDADPEWESWQYPTSVNPLVSETELTETQASMPEALYRQEIEATFESLAGAVFRNVQDCAIAEHQDRAKDGMDYLIAVDWGKSVDFTVVTVWCINAKEMVYIDRFNRVSWEVQIGRLRAIVEAFMPTTIVAERNSIGDPIIEQLQGMGWNVTPFVTTLQSKTLIVQKLALGFETRTVKILDDPILIGELQTFTATPLPSGAMRYAAPKGGAYHDDTVISTAIGWDAVQSQEPLIWFET